MESGQGQILKKIFEFLFNTEYEQMKIREKFALICGLDQLNIPDYVFRGYTTTNCSFFLQLMVPMLVCLSFGGSLIAVNSIHVNAPVNHQTRGILN